MAPAAVLSPSLDLPVSASVFLSIFFSFSLHHLCVTLRKLKMGVQQARVFGLRGNLIKYKRKRYFFNVEKMQPSAVLD